MLLFNKVVVSFRLCLEKLILVQMNVLFCLEFNAFCISPFGVVFCHYFWWKLIHVSFVTCHCFFVATSIIFKKKKVC
jgi:hypothetical protein